MWRTGYLPDCSQRFLFEIALRHSDSKAILLMRKRPVRTVFPRQSKPVILEEWEVRETRKY
jgi:hypothetical protein